MRNHTEQIKDKIDIVELIGSYIKLEKAGINYKARCPFHNEKTPSFYVSASRQNFYCFGCGEKGDIFTFVEKFEGLDFLSALKKLGDKCGVEIGESGSYTDKKPLDDIYAVMKEAASFFAESLKTAEKVKNYLENRGVTPETIAKWEIGYARDGWRNLYDHLTVKGFSPLLMRRAGLLKETSGKQYDTFRDRIIFPIKDTDGRVVAFSGRQFGENDKAPKYLNSPETEVFKKSKTLYGWDIARNAIRKLDYAVLVEGQFDLVLAHQIGTPNTVASSGTALTLEHLKLIKRLTDRIILSYDGDKAGEVAALRATELALSIGMEVKIASINDGDDPASLIKNDAESWKESLRKAQHVIDYMLGKAITNYSGMNLIKEVEKNILPYLLWIESDIERAHFIKRIADKIHIKEEAISNDLRKIDKQGNYDESKKESLTVKKDAILSGIIYSEGEESPTQEKLTLILGKEAVDLLKNNYEPDREKLMFEAEEYAINSKQTTGELAEELLRRIELEHLRTQLSEATSKMDRGKSEEKIIENIYTRIKELQASKTNK